MGRWFSIRSRQQGVPGDVPPLPAHWYDRMCTLAQANGAMPYVVEGFFEISDAVRRGHSVLLLRQPCEVAEGVRVFDREVTPALVGSPIADWYLRSGDSPVVTLARFDASTARYVLHDAASAAGSVELTPKRLQRYLSSPDRAVGVALAA